MSDYDQRQYRLMLQTLVAYEQGRATLDQLAGNLEALLNVLEQVEPSWRQTFLHECGKLEDHIAYEIFKELTTRDEESNRRILDAVAQLKLLVFEKMDDAADHSEQ